MLILYVEFNQSVYLAKIQLILPWNQANMEKVQIHGYVFSTIDISAKEYLIL